jgi:hypothetical protein
MAITLDGTLGITSPAETVQGALTTTGNTILGDATTDTLTVGVTGIVKDASGNVGIGTSIPATKLHVVGSSLVTTTSFFGDTGYYTALSGGNPILVFDANDYMLYDRTSNFLQTVVGGSERMRIDSSGNVGIGTASPITKLDVSQANVKSATAAWQLSVTDLTSQTTGVGGGISFTGYKTGTTALEFFAGIDGYKENATAGNAAGALRFHTQVSLGTGLVERARIDSSGNLLVGQTSASQTTVGFFAKPNGEVSGCQAASTNAGGTQWNTYSTGAGAYRFYVGMGGTIFATSIVISAISDQRLKENVRDLDTGLDAIMALQPRRFDWKEGKGQDKKNAAGFIAQEFETVFPECVSTSMAGADGIEYKNINHETLIPTFVKAIQELKAIVDAQAVRIAALEA